MQKNELNVQLFDAREPLMQPNSGGLNPDNDYLHFCMNSAAINIYLDMYWTEVFSTHVVNEAAVLHRQTEEMSLEGTLASLREM